MPKSARHVSDPLMAGSKDNYLRHGGLPMYPHRNAEEMIPCTHALRTLLIHNGWMQTHMHSPQILYCHAPGTDDPTCSAKEKPNSLAIASIATLSTIRSMLHRARVRAKGMVSLVNEISAIGKSVSQGCLSLLPYAPPHHVPGLTRVPLNCICSLSGRDKSDIPASVSEIEALKSEE